MDQVLKYTFDDFEADLKAAELRRHGTRLKLQLQPFQVLVALLEKPREVVTREELRLRLWPEDTFVDFDHGLNTAMAKLRDALGDSAARPRFVETIAKRGYRFNGEVQAILASPRTPPVAAETAAGGGAPSPAVIQPAQSASASPVAIAPPTAVAEPGLPRASRPTARLLFTLCQIMYLVFYLCALFRLERLYQSSVIVWRSAAGTVFYVYAVTALVGVAVRLYLITATSFDYHLLGEKYRVIYPGLFLLDMLWALAPFLIADRIGMGLALGATAALVYMPFAQRVLMKMMQSGWERPTLS
jgi:DNA-binding winged helix-turn-helix (wHTH) protein